MDKKLSVVGFILGAKELQKMKRVSAAVVVVAAVWWSIFGFFLLRNLESLLRLSLLLFEYLELG
jgi:hypothetical protein